MSQLRIIALFSLALTALGCDGEMTPGSDAGVSADASVPSDAMTGTDAATVDAAMPSGSCPLASLCGDTEIIVDSDWLEMHLGDTDVQVVDVRSEADFMTSRIQGAIRLEGGALRTTVDGIGGQVVSMPDAQLAFREAGLRSGAAIVVYGASTGTGPARVVWTLEYFSHARVALLEGGFAAWNDGSRATDTGAATATPSMYTIGAIDSERRVDAAFISTRLDDPTLALVDARTDAEYAAGHIPGALSVDWTRNLAGGLLLDDASIRALYASIDSTGTTVAYCQTGSRASVSYVVLRSLGFADVRLYDGSWSEWGSRSDLPREP